MLSHFVKRFVVEVFREMAKAPKYLIFVCVEVLLERLNHRITRYVIMSVIVCGLVLSGVSSP